MTRCCGGCGKATAAGHPKLFYAREGCSSVIKTSSKRGFLSRFEWVEVLG